MPEHGFTPAHDRSSLPHVGSYRRVLPVSLTRLYENVLDWAHLPHLHETTFAAATCRAAGPWGWQATVAYRFDVVTGECVSGAPCRLAPLPEVEDTARGVRVRVV